MEATRRQKTIRESVHGDIVLYGHELDVVNTRVFQRLHGIKQLGMAYLVYPTATHTRFEHSLGCVHVAQRIIDQLRTVGVTARRELEAQFPVDEHFPISPALEDRIRMAALLHDLTHIPYGHTLENELGLLDEHHDADESRLVRFFNRLREELAANQVEDQAYLGELLDFTLATIRTIKLIDDRIRSTQQKAWTIEPLPRHEWFAADIIGNTICADLLDYSRRDMRATGLNQDYDDRLFSYFDLARDKDNNIRLALRTTKDQGLRLDAVSEILHVLRIRYTLSERVLFHHTKNVASAMLGELLSIVQPSPAAFDDMRDEELLPWVRSFAASMAKAGRLSDAEHAVVVDLADRLESRRLHKGVFRVGPAQQEPYQVANARHLGEEYANVRAREAFRDRILEHVPQLQLGDIIIYCPARKMTMMEVWANVLARKGDHMCRPLRDEETPYLPGVIADEVEALEKKYEALWSWSAVLAPEKLDYAFALQAFIQQELRVSNDPFLQTYLEAHPGLQTGREIMKRAPGAYRTQAEAVAIFIDRRQELEEAAAAGDPSSADLYQMAVDRARREIYGMGTEQP
jgi:HD superfamily phosphohydrolase